MYPDIALLTAYLQAQLPYFVHVQEFQAITDGWETEVYRFRLEKKNFILRLYPSANGSNIALHEYTGLEGLQQMGYPVPTPYFCHPDPALLGKPFIIMEQIEGAALLQTLEQGHLGEYLSRFIGLLVQLHQLEHPQRLDPPSAATLVNAWRTSDLATFPEFTPLWAWLEEQIDTITFKKPSILHRDYHPANVLLTPADSLYVIDWSSWGMGDSRSDLAWTLMLCSTYGQPELRDILLNLYEQQVGRFVPHIEFFEVLACLRRLGDMVRSVLLGSEQSGMRPDTVQIMKTQAEHYLKVLEILQNRTGLAFPHLQIRIEQLGRR